MGGAAAKGRLSLLHRLQASVLQLINADSVVCTASCGWTYRNGHCCTSGTCLTRKPFVVAQAVHARCFAYMLQLPAAPGCSDADAATATGTAAADGGQAADPSAPEAAGTSALLAPEPPTGWSTEGLPRVLRHGTMHLPPYARLAAAHFGAFGPDLLRQVKLCVIAFDATCRSSQQSMCITFQPAPLPCCNSLRWVQHAQAAATLQKERRRALVPLLALQGLLHVMLSDG